jgi:hypothetical protein
VLKKISINGISVGNSKAVTIKPNICDKTKLNAIAFEAALSPDGIKVEGNSESPAR